MWREPEQDVGVIRGLLQQVWLHCISIMSSPMSPGSISDEAQPLCSVFFPYWPLLSLVSSCLVSARKCWAGVFRFFSLWDPFPNKYCFHTVSIWTRHRNDLKTNKQKNKKQKGFSCIAYIQEMVVVSTSIVSDVNMTFESCVCLAAVTDTVCFDDGWTATWPQRQKQTS